MRWIILTFGLALAGCIPTAQDTATPGGQPADDPCGAAAYATLTGTPASDLPSFPEGKVVRIYDPATDMVTKDYRTDRLNVQIDRSQNRVLRLSCG